MVNAFWLGTVSFGARAVTETTNVMKKPKWIHVATTGGVAHSSWLGVRLHLDDDFLHCLRYNCVERGRAIFSAGRTQLFECVRKGFTSFHGQCAARQARWLPLAMTLKLTASSILAVAVRSINTPPLFFFFLDCPETYAGGGRVTKNLLYVALEYHNRWKHTQLETQT